MTDTADFEAMERNGWSDPAIAKGYADGFEVATRQVARQMCDIVDAGANRVILDLCCGHGVVTRELIANGATVTGLDFSPAMIALAEANVPGATYLEGDAMAMRFPDQSFDAVTIGFGVPHFPDPARGLAEAGRVTKSGGRLAFSIWRGKGSDGSFGWLFDAFARLGDASVSLPAGPDAHLLADRAIAEQMVEAAGFRDVRVSDVASEFWLTSPEALFDVFDQGAVRAAALLGGQSQDVRDAIRADLAEKVRTYGTQDGAGYRVATPSVVVSGVRT